MLVFNVLWVGKKVLNKFYVSYSYCRSRIYYKL